MSSTSMDISETFRPEDLSKTDFFDFVTAPDLGIAIDRPHTASEPNNNNSNNTNVNANNGNSNNHNSNNAHANNTGSSSNANGTAEQALQGFDQVRILPLFQSSIIIWP